MVHRIVFLGQKPIGEGCFSLLCNQATPQVQVVGVVTNQGADPWWGSNFIWRKAQSLGLPVLDNARRQTAQLEQLLRDTQATWLVSVQHPWILPPRLLEMVKGQAINLHNAKLPDYKGHNAVNHALLNGETTYTSTLHWMSAGVDEGPIAFEETIVVHPHDHARSLYQRALQSGEQVFKKFLACLKEGRPVPQTPMPPGGTFYERHSIEALRHITDLTNTTQVARQARALYFPPFEPAWFLVEGQKYYVVPEPPVTPEPWPSPTPRATQARLEPVDPDAVRVYAQNDWVLTALQQQERPGDEDFIGHKWLKETLAKRLIYARLYADLLAPDAPRRRVLDVGGSYGALSRLLVRQHDYALVELAAHDPGEKLKAEEAALGKPFWHNQDWRAITPEGVYDVVICNDMLPNVDQGLTAFLEKFLPHCRQMRLSLTFYNVPRHYLTKRVGADELLTLAAYSGPQVREALLPFLPNPHDPALVRLLDPPNGLYANQRNVVTLVLDMSGV